MKTCYGYTNNNDLWAKIRKDYRRAGGYYNNQDALRAFAIEWQLAFSGAGYSWGDVLKWESFFREYGKRFGLLREFAENGIC